VLADAGAAARQGRRGVHRAIVEIALDVPSYTGGERELVRLEQSVFIGAEAGNAAVLADELAPPQSVATESFKKSVRHRCGTATIAILRCCS
jgi:hypothetical protein